MAPVLQADPPCPAGLVPDLRLEFVESFWRDAPLAPVVRDAEPQELALLRSRHRALRLVDLQPQLLGQEPAHRGHHAFTSAAAANIDIAVSRAVESHRRALAEPDVRLSPHPAPIVRPRPCKSPQWANSDGCRRATR